MSEGGYLVAGAVLSDRYTLKKHEWTSPAGEVWLARDRVLDRPVFVQALSQDLGADPASKRAFLKGAARIAQFNDAAVLQVFDIGESPAFVVVEHASGGRLADRLTAGAMRTTDAVRAALSIARGLEALHDRGAAHGSLSPETVLFDPEGRAKLLALGFTPASGEPAVAQPEGYRTPEPDALPADADRYALAALTYHMLTGKAPARGAARARRSMPAQIESLLQRALSADPAARPGLDEFEAALAPFARVEPTEARGPRFSASEFNWLIPAVIIIVLAVLAVTFGVGYVQDLADRREESPTPTPSATAGEALDIEGAQDFDFEPNGGNGEENPEDVDRAIDGEAETYWGTLGYTTADLGGSKEGVGLLLDLGEATPLAQVRIKTGLEGWSGQIRVADAFSEDVDDYVRVERFTAGTDTTVDLPADTRGRYVLIWITNLAEQGGKYPYGAEISEVELFAA